VIDRHPTYTGVGESSNARAPSPSTDSGSIQGARMPLGEV
jgi:hypothetical protein